MFTQYDKSIAAFIGAVLPLLAAFGIKIPISADVLMTLVPFLSAFLTFFVPNKLPAIADVTVAVPARVSAPSSSSVPGGGPGGNQPGWVPPGA